MYNTESQYLDGVVDDLVFFSNIPYSKKYVETTHQGLISSGSYSAAAEYLNAQDGVTPYSAGLFNLMANRLNALQTILLQKESNRVMIVSETEPENPDENTNWID